MLKIHTEWLSNAEKILVSFKYPSKLVDKVTMQIQDHKVCNIGRGHFLSLKRSMILELYVP